MADIEKILVFSRKGDEPDKNQGTIKQSTYSAL
jgi:hypothetical protein